jgi:hypothetical protein
MFLDRYRFQVVLGWAPRTIFDAEVSKMPSLPVVHG